MRRLLVLLPCLNEAAALPGLLQRLGQLRQSLAGSYELSALVVDDGSSDATAAIATAPRDDGLTVELVMHADNQGLGAALLSGLQHFAKHCGPADCLAAMDADSTHPPELLASMLARLEQGAEVVIASRYAPGGGEHGLSLRRRIYSLGACLLLGSAARIPGVRDYTCGYRLYSMDALQRGLQRYGAQLITERSFVCMAELLCHLGACRAICAEVPLDLHYELKQGPSKMNVPVTIRRYVALLRRLLFTQEFRRE